MHRIDGPGHLANHWTEGDPVTGEEPTQVTADFQEAVQEEISAVIEAGGLALNKSNNAQLLQAIGLVLVGNRWLGRNLLINGHFSFYQRVRIVPTFTGRPTNGAGGTWDVDDNPVMVFDRWEIQADDSTGLGIVNVDNIAFAAGQTDVPVFPNPLFAAFGVFMKCDTTTAPTIGTCRVEQRIESYQRFQGRDVVGSIYLKADAPVTVTGKIIVDHGTGGSPSADLEIASVAFSVTTAWTRFELTGLVPLLGSSVLGNLHDHLKLQFRWSGTPDIDFAAGQFELGTSATALEFVPWNIENDRVERFCERSCGLHGSIENGASDDPIRAWWGGDVKVGPLGGQTRVDHYAPPLVTHFDYEASQASGAISWNGTQAVTPLQQTVDSGLITSPTVGASQAEGEVEAFWLAESEIPE